MRTRAARLVLLGSLLVAALLVLLWDSTGEDAFLAATARDGKSTPERGRQEAIAVLNVVDSAAAQRVRAELRPAPRASVEERAAAAALAGIVHGRAIDVRTGLGVADCTVTFSASGDEKLSVTSDATGFFQLSPDESSRVHSFYVKPPRRWRWRKVQDYYATVMPPAMRSGEHEVLVELAERRTGVVSGVAVSTTGEPLPDFGFSLRAGSEITEACTDENGAFITETELRGGRKLVWSEPGGGSARPVQVDVCPGVPLRLTFQVGPVVELELAGEAPPAGEPLGLWIFTESAFLPRSARPARLHRRADGSWWARPAKTGLADGLPVVLAVGDAAGSFYGYRRELHSGAGWNRPLRFELERTGTIETTVTRDDPGDDAVDSERGALEAMQRLGHLVVDVDVDRADGGMFPRPVDPAHDGRWLRPGVYRIAAATRIHEERSETIELEGGEVARVDLHLPILAQHRTVRGQVRTESGRPVSSLTVRLSVGGRRARSVFESSPPPGGCVSTADVLLQQHADGTASFRFEFVPLGPAEVSVTEGRYACRIKTDDAPNGDLRIEVVQLDTPGGPGMGFRFEAEAGGPPSARVETRVLDSGQALHPDAFPGRVLTRELPAERRLEWAFLMQGKRPVYGTQADFRNTGDDLWLANVAPGDGWGTRVLTRDPAGNAVEGALVLVDGEVSGWTDASGLLEVATDAPPLTLQAVDSRRSRESALELIDAWKPPPGWQTLVVRSRP